MLCSLLCLSMEITAYSAIQRSTAMMRKPRLYTPSSWGQSPNCQKFLRTAKTHDFLYFSHIFSNNNGRCSVSNRGALTCRKIVFLFDFFSKIPKKLGLKKILFWVNLFRAKIKILSTRIFLYLIFAAVCAFRNLHCLASQTFWTQDVAEKRRGRENKSGGKA